MAAGDGFVEFQVYTGTCMLIEHGFPSQESTYEIVDSGNYSRRYTACELRALGNGLIFSYSRTGDRPLFFGSIITNTWTEIPASSFIRSCPDRVVAFTLDGGEYRLVYWNMCGAVFVYDQGQSEWTMVQKYKCLTNPVVLNNTTMFCLDCKAVTLIEYSVDGNFSSRQLITNQKFEPECIWLVLWEDKLYMFILAEHEHQVLQLWEISTDEGYAVLLSECKPKAKYMGNIFNITLEKNILHCYCRTETERCEYLEIDMEKRELVKEYVHAPGELRKLKIIV